MDSSERFYSPEKVLLKMESWCAYQDRCEFEVREKIKKFQLSLEDETVVIEKLKTNLFFDDARFVESYVSGKFRIKRWGRLKIRQMLNAKRVDKKLVESELAALDDLLYLECIDFLIEKKNRLTNEKDAWKKRQKIIQYVASRGFEIDLIQDRLKQFKPD
ncbi:MAG: recombination regulator RecX [Bacteroidetes bacterium]|nr:recombination regulator RecX [Bacteroidota bacterium]